MLSAPRTFTGSRPYAVVVPDTFAYRDLQILSDRFEVPSNTVSPHFTHIQPNARPNMLPVQKRRQDELYNMYARGSSAAPLGFVPNEPDIMRSGSDKQERAYIRAVPAEVSRM